MDNMTMPSERRMPFARRVIPLLLGVSLLGGCAAPKLQQVSPGEVPIVLGPSVRDNRTPMENVFACYSGQIAASATTPIVVAVGDIKDYTGKYSIDEGNAITQGGALMVYSALGKLGGAVGVAERFDPTVAERELGYTDRRQLGDGEIHEISGPQGGQQVPWVPYYGGTIRKSDYYIVGGITELNYNLNSGGAEAAVNQIGAKVRTFNQSIGIDLRIVDTNTLMVVRTVSLTKQLIGYEVGGNIFRFFGSDLFDINIGAKGQEPLQLGVRTALEEGVLRLIGAVTRIDPAPCLQLRDGSQIPPQSAAEIRQAAAPPAIAAPAPPPPLEPAPATPPPAAPVPAAPPSQPVDGAINAGPRSGARPAVETVIVAFEFGSAVVTGPTLINIDRAAAMSKVGPVELIVVVRDTENWDPGKRDELLDQRIAAIKSALADRGIAPAAVVTTWRPAPSDTSIHRDGPGLQEIARLRVGA